MAAKISIVSFELGKPEARPVYPVVNLAGLIAGQHVRYSQIGASRSVGYPREGFDPWNTAQNQAQVATAENSLPLNKV